MSLGGFRLRCVIMLCADDLSRFPKVSKDTLKVTLDEVAVRVGQKEADKKWVCR